MPSALPVSSVKKMEAQLGHVFKDKSLIITALTHSSAGAASNYERLEFLGDRVLGLVVADMLYTRFPDEKEGDLARRLASLVQGSFLAEIAHELDLGAYIIFSEAEAHAGGAGNDNILSDVFEALLGALYLDGGFQVCREAIGRLWTGKLDVEAKPPQHPKTQLQEWAQGRGLPLPEYKIISQHGPDHAPVFEIELTVKGFKSVIGQGRSRQVAERAAAANFFELHGANIHE
jgi:ribonuclease-3